MHNRFVIPASCIECKAKAIAELAWNERAAPRAVALLCAPARRAAHNTEGALSRLPLASTLARFSGPPCEPSTDAARLLAVMIRCGLLLAVLSAAAPGAFAGWCDRKGSTGSHCRGGENYGGFLTLEDTNCGHQFNNRDNSQWCARDDNHAPAR